MNVAEGKLLPDLLLPLLGLFTGLAWDNYDELTETLSGRDTLHDTVGICYQNRPSHVVEASRTADAMDTADTNTKNKGPAAKRPLMAQTARLHHTRESPHYQSLILRYTPMIHLQV